MTDTVASDAATDSSLLRASNRWPTGQDSEFARLRDDFQSARLRADTSQGQLISLQDAIITASILRCFVQVNLPAELVSRISEHLIKQLCPHVRLDGVSSPDQVRDLLIGDTALAHAFQDDLYKVFLRIARFSEKPATQDVTLNDAAAAGVQHLSWHLGTLDTDKHWGDENYAPSFSKGPLARNVARIQRTAQAFPEARTLAMMLNVRIGDDMNYKDVRYSDEWYSRQYVALLQVASTALPKCQIALQVNVFQEMSPGRNSLLGKELLLRPSPKNGEEGDTGSGLMWEVSEALRDFCRCF